MKLTPRQFGATPPAGGLQAVVQRGRDLRRRRVLVGTGASSAVVAIGVAAVLAFTGGSTNQSLEYAGPTPAATPGPTSTETAMAEPSPSAGGDESGATPMPAETPPDCVNNDCNELEESPNPPAMRPSYTEHPTSSFETKTTCYDAGGEPISGRATCVMSDSDQDVTVRRGSAISMPMRLCVASNAAGPVTYHFPGGGEHEVRVSDGDTLVWSFAASVQFTGGAHDVQLLPRQCRGYTTTWRTTDQGGTPLPAGDYVVNVRSLASSRGGQAWPDDEKGLPFFELHLTE